MNGSEKLHVALIIAAGLLLGTVGALLALPWIVKRRWRRSMWERRDGS